MTWIYKTSDSKPVEFIQVFTDEDQEESLYCCAWGASESGLPIIFTGGVSGVVKGFNCITFTLDALLTGHGNSVNDIKMHTVDDSLCFTASQDESIRMWNIRTSMCVAIFAGDKGHRLNVLTIAIHPLGNCFVSGGMDTSIRIWNLEAPEVQTAIKKCADLQGQPDSAVFDVIIVQFPVFSTSQVHHDYIDNVGWAGDLVISQAVRDKIVLWAPHSIRYKGAPLILREYDVKGLDNWFVKMDICLPLNLFAIGTFLENRMAKICVFSIDGDREQRGGTGRDVLEEPMTPPLNREDEEEQEISRMPYAAQPPVAVLTVAQKDCIRQVSFSVDGSRLIGCCESGTIYIWKISVS
eukprot:CAMPEP_0182419830 /NCGR_PEP_ID=MMETSP1167-20130531/4188_1 /TAXON_ID=2988 /ORGANISM="Mallomonas Sp, Strain CCMP3275" /LENGTH=351 /DNA_ID=CAMNT_0024594941 /DNA_START=174 /DNA_END=1229 /DNA_ORIENTATION=-